MATIAKDPRHSKVPAAAVLVHENRDHPQDLHRRIRLVITNHDCRDASSFDDGIDLCRGFDMAYLSSHGVRLVGSFSWTIDALY